MVNMVRVSVTVPVMRLRLSECESVTVTRSCLLSDRSCVTDGEGDLVTLMVKVKVRDLLCQNEVLKEKV